MKILFPTDGSEGAEAALDFLAALPLRDSDEVLVLCVPVYLAMATTPELQVGQIVAIATEHAKWLTDRAAERLAARGVRARSIVEDGAVVDTITTIARSERADLVVVGSRGLGAVGGLILGSTAKALVHRSPTPVLVVRHRRVAPRRILATVDGTDEACRALDLLGGLPLPAGIELTLLHVLPQGHTNGLGTRRSALEIMGHATRVLDLASVDNVLSEPDHLAQQVVGRAKAIGADLIVLGCAGLHERPRLALEDALDRILVHAPCPVLVAACGADRAGRKKPEAARI